MIPLGFIVHGLETDVGISWAFSMPSYKSLKGGPLYLERLYNCLLDCFCPPLSRKRGDIKSHSSVCPSVCLSVCPSVTKTLTLAITFALLQIELWYLYVCSLWQDLSGGTMSWPWRWPLTFFKVKFVAERGTTILWICLFWQICP